MVDYNYAKTYGRVLFINSYKPRVGTLGSLTALIAMVAACGGGNPASPTPLGSRTTPPIIVNGAPTGMRPAGTIEETISWATDEIAKCKYDVTGGKDYDAMQNMADITGGMSHSSKVAGLQNGGQYAFAVRCIDSAGNNNTADYWIRFGIAVPATISGTVTTSDGVPVNGGKIEFFNVAQSGNNLVYTSLGSGTINGGTYSVNINNPSAAINRTRMTENTSGTRILNKETNYTGDSNYKVFERQFFNGQDPNSFWNAVNRELTVNGGHAGAKRADPSRPLTFYIDTTTQIGGPFGNTGRVQSVDERIAIFESKMREIYLPCTNFGSFQLIRTNNPPPWGKGVVVVKFTSGPPLFPSSASLFNGYILDGGEITVPNITLSGFTDAEEIAGFSLFYGFDNSIEPSIANEPSSSKLETIDQYLIKLSRFEKLGTRNKTLDGIVIEEYEPF